MSSKLKAVILSVTGINLLAAGSLLLLRPFGAAALMAGLVACGLGMRHAFDADHIAAIDNVTRQLRQRGERPVAVGLFFSLGHSSVVLLLVLGLALAFGRMHGAPGWLTEWGTLASTVFSALILTGLGLANLAVFGRLVRNRHAPQAATGLTMARPWLARSLGAIDHSWRMYPVGMLFGLGFDTATEVALLALSVGAVQSGHFPLWAIMIFPLLFTAGMCLMDTLQSLLMLRVYDWAIADDNRSLQLNTVVTGISVLLALGIAGLRWTDLAGISTGFAGLAGGNIIGLLVTGALALMWFAARYRRRRGDAATVVLNSSRE